jgi:hypothetical protein
MYSAYVEDVAVVVCVLADHDTNALPKKKHEPEVDLALSLSPPQSASALPCYFKSP